MVTTFAAISSPIPSILMFYWWTTLPNQKQKQSVCYFLLFYSTRPTELHREHIFHLWKINADIIFPAFRRIYKSYLPAGMICWTYKQAALIRSLFPQCICIGYIYARGTMLNSGVKYDTWWLRELCDYLY